MVWSDEAYCRWKGWQDEAFSVCSKEEELYFDCEMSRLRARGLPSAEALKVLELGFGNGAFAGYARKHGWHWVGIEANEVLVDKARTCGFVAYPSGKEPSSILRTESLDLLVAFDVLEHLDLDGIKEVLGSAMLLLRPGGFVLARVPSGDSPFGRAIAHGDITHKTILGSSAILQLSEMLGFTLERVASPCLPVRGVGIRRALRRLGILLARRVIAAFVNAIFHENAPRVISPNMVFVLRKPTVHS